MTIESRQVGNRVVLEVAGRMDAENAPAFQAACQTWISQGFNDLVIDLGELSYVSSLGLRSFIVVGKQLQQQRGKLRICRPTGLVKQVFEMTRLSTIFPSHDSVEAALQDA
jgi:anti-anti-sigma factor